jgi:hypothetical protein
VHENHGALALGCVECSLERRPDGDHDAHAGLRLSKPDMLTVIGVPWKAKQVALALTGPKPQQQRQMKMRGRFLEEGQLVGIGPNLIRARPS